MTVVDLQPPMSPERERPRKQWTRAECRRIDDAGALLPEPRYELIEGDLFSRMGQNQSHVFVMLQLIDALVAIFTSTFVQSQTPIAVSDISEPEPDAFVTAEPRRHYLLHGAPTPADIRLVAEVSDSTLWFDTTIKAALYARAGIPEYWVVDVTGRRVIVHRQPGADGYEDYRSAAEGDSVAPLAAPQRPVAVRDLLP